MSDVMEVTDSNFNTEVLQSSKPTVVDFWAPWCMPCRMMAPILDDFAKKNADRVKVVKLNTDENPQTATTYRIMSIPSLVFFKNGQEASRVIGVRPSDALEAELAKVEKG
jgi:thioredoxin 1